MSLSINDILKPLAGLAKEQLTKKLGGVLNNPDLPTLANKFDDKKEIRERAYSSLKLSSHPRNGSGYMLPRTRADDDPRKDSFLMDGAIDPNVIRKRVNPDKAIPSLETGLSTLFSLVPSN